MNSNNMNQEANIKHQEALKKNVRRNEWFILTSSFALTESIWMLYLAHKGMNLIEIGLLESIFHMTSFTMEIPTGMVADRYGRKTSRVLGRLLACIATLLMLMSNSFWMFAVAFIMTALGYNLESGAGDALVYDSLVATDATEQYMKIKGRQEIYYQVARISSLALGGWVAQYSYDIAYGTTIGVYALALWQALYFVEPKIGEKVQESSVNMMTHIRDSLQVIKDHGHILPYVLYIEVFSFFYTTMYFYMQNALKAVGYVESSIGLTLAGAAFLSVVTASQAFRIEAKLGIVRLIRMGTLLAIGCLFIVAFTPYAIVGFSGMALTDGLLYVSFCSYINELIPSSHRATLLSFQSMVFSSLMIFCFPAFGAISEYIGFSWAFKGLFILGLPTFTLSLWHLKKQVAAS